MLTREAISELRKMGARESLRGEAVGTDTNSAPPSGDGQADGVTSARVIATIRIRYLVTLASLAALAVLSYLTLDALIAANQGGASLVNVSGRQRMLSQRISMLSEQLVNSPDTSEEIQAKLRQAIETMASSHRMLVESDTRVGGTSELSEALRARYFGPTSQVDAEVRSYLDHALQLVAARGELNASDPVLVEMRRARESLLSDLDGVVRQYQLESDTVVTRLRRRAQIYAVLALVLLASSAVVVFQPLVRRAEVEMRRLDEARAVLRGILDSELDAIVTIDDNGRVVEANGAAQQLLGVQPGGLFPEFDEARRSDAQRDGLVGELAPLFDQAERPLGRWMEVTARRADGSLFPAEVSLTSVALDRRRMITACVRDITDRRQAEDGQRLAATVFETVSQAIMVTDAQARIITVNPFFSEITGYEAAEVIGKNPSLLKSGRHDLAFFQHFWQSLERTGTWQGEIWNRRKNGEIFPEWLSINSITDSQGRVTRYVAVFSDITDRKQAEVIIWRQANFDELTDLSKRGLFQQHVQKALAVARRQSSLVAVLFIDLDRFKLVNDTHGHQAGDAVLVEVSRRLEASVRATDTVARVGGDEFAAALIDVRSRDDVERIIREMLTRVGAPYTVEGIEVTISGSIGVALFPSDGDDASTLLRNADSAMYQAKVAGLNDYRFFSAPVG